MEEDRAQVDLGVAVDVEARLEESAAQRQPKKRFVGRRQAAEAASKNGSTSIEESGAIQGLLCFLPYGFNCANIKTSLDTSEKSANVEPSASRDTERCRFKRSYRTPPTQLFL